jgi:hypothetical protein
VPTIPKMMPRGKTRTQDRRIPSYEIFINDTIQKNNIAQFQEGGRNTIQKLTRKKKSQRGSTKGLPHIEKETRGVIGQVRREEMKMEAQKMSMEEG